jgi:putative endonuclease
MFYTYALLSEKDNHFYCGFTIDLKKRVNEHQTGLVSSTANRRPLKLVYYEACLNETDAVKREKYFKTGFGRRFLRNRLETFLESIK